MSNQIVISSGAKVRALNGVITGTSGVLSSVPLGAANGVATLDSTGKVPSSQLPTFASSYKGTWDASTNTPYIHDGTGTAGDYYLVSTAGTQNLGSGSITFAVGNTVIYSGSIWQKAGSSSGTVTSVDFTAPAAFNVSGSPITSSGTIALTVAGTSLQYINGAGTLTTFPILTGFVPYTGATGTVDLGTNILGAGVVSLTGTASNTNQASGAPFIYLQGGGSSFTTIQQAVGKLSFWQFDGSIFNNTFNITNAGAATFSSTVQGSAIYVGSSGTSLATDGTSLYLKSGGITYLNTANSAYITSTGGAIFSNSIIINNGAISFGGSGSAPNSDPAIYRISGVNDMAFSVNSSEKLRIKNGGNVLIGTTSDGGYKLSVNGTANFTGSVNIEGANDLYSGNVWVRGDGSSNGGSLRFRQTSSVTSGWPQNTVICAASNNQLLLNFWYDTSGGFERYKGVTFRNDNITINATRTYYFPDADGTLALTSNLSSYLPLSGGTLTGSITATQHNVTAMNTAPATSTSTGTLGEIRFASGAIYVCTATNTWVRALLTTF